MTQALNMAARHSVDVRLDTAQALVLQAYGRGHQHPAKLATAVGMEPTQLTATLDQLTACGIDISCRHDGRIAITAPTSPLSPDAILAHLEPDSTASLGTLDIRLQIDSTNDWLKRNRSNPDPPYPARACLAEHQSAGRGRRGRHWQSPPFDNVYLSLAWRYASPDTNLDGLSLALGVAASYAAQDCGVPQLAIKWPNDLYWHDSKLGGILVELIPSADAITVIAGIGINTSPSACQSSAIDQPCTDLASASEGGGEIDRNQLAGRLLHHFCATLREFPTHGLDHWRDAYAQRDALHQRAVRVHHSDGSSINGIANGIDRHGALTVTTVAGPIQHQAGDVSIRLRDQQRD